MSLREQEHSGGHGHPKLTFEHRLSTAKRDDPVGDTIRQDVIMGHEQHAKFSLADDLRHEVDDLLLRDGVEPRGRLVREEEQRLDEKRAGKRDTLELTTRNLVGATLQQVRSDAHAVQQGLDRPP